MAPLAASVLISFGGALPGNEQWRCGLWMAGDPDLITQTQLQALVNDAATALGSMWSDSGVTAIKGNGTTLNSVVGYSYPVAGSPAALRAEKAVSYAAGTNATSMPNQVCVVASLRSATPSRRSMGRFYFPCQSGALTDGRLSTTTAQQLATSFAALCTALNASTATSDVVVAGSSAAPVTSVVVDNVLDTQRRRRKSMAATVKASGAVS